MTVDRKRLENTMISESVIYMDGNGRRVPAIIAAVHDERIVDLLLPISGEVVEKVEFSSNDAPLRWWRRIRF